MSAGQDIFSAADLGVTVAARRGFKRWLRYIGSVYTADEQSMTPMLRILALTLLVWVLPAARAEDPQLDAIVACIGKNFPRESAQHHIGILSRDAQGGKTRLQARLFWQPSTGEQNRIHVQLIEPADLAGSAYLLVQTPNQESLFLFVPGLNRVRRLRGEAMAGELWGTSLSYQDFRYLYGIAVNSDFSVRPPAQRQGRAVHVLRAPVPPAGGWGYAAVQLEVDQPSCVVTRVEFLDAEDVMLKVLQVDVAGLRQIDGYWTASRLTLHDHQHGTEVELEVKAAQFDRSLPAGLFDSRGFHLVRLPSIP